jgi:hypothetical protein
MGYILFFLIAGYVIWANLEKETRRKLLPLTDTQEMGVHYTFGVFGVIAGIVVISIVTSSVYRCGKEIVVSTADSVQKVSAMIKEVKQLRQHIEKGTISSRSVLPTFKVSIGEKYFYNTRNTKTYIINNCFGNIEISTTTNRTAKISWEIFSEPDDNRFKKSVIVKLQREKNQLRIFSEVMGHSFDEESSEFFLKLLIPDADLDLWRKNLLPARYTDDKKAIDKPINFVESFLQLRAPISINLKLRCPKKSSIIVKNFVGNIRVDGNYKQVKTNLFLGDVFLTLLTQQASMNRISVNFGNVELFLKPPLQGDFEINNDFVGRTIVYLPAKSSYNLKAVTNLIVSNPDHSKPLFPFNLSIGRLIRVSIGIDLKELMGFAKIKSDIPFLEPSKNINQQIDTSVGGGKSKILINSGLGNIYITKTLDSQ